MNNWQRVLAYSTGSLALGLLLIIAGSSWIRFTGMEGTTGYLVLLAYGFVYLNLGFGVSRRYSMKTRFPRPENYLFTTLLAVPTLVWIYTKDEGLDQTTILLFASTILFGLWLGTYYGIRRGLARRQKLLEQLQDEQNLPDDLKRPHDSIHKN